MNLQVDFSVTLAVPVTLWVKLDNDGRYKVTSAIVSHNPSPAEVTEALDVEELERLDVAVGQARREASR